MKKSKLKQVPVKPARSYKASLISFLEALKTKDFVFEFLALFSNLLYFESIFFEFAMKHFIDSCIVD